MFAEYREVLATGRSRRVGFTLVGSLALGLLAGGASVGLLALSGWFIAISALSGAGLVAGFSFFYPSAGVQALAFTRTVLRYGERLTGHVAALRLDAALKEHLFAVAVAPGDGIENEQTGTLLHAVTSDAEVAENSLLRVLSPVVTYVGVVLGGCAVLAKVNLLVSALVALGGVALALIVVAPSWAWSLRPGRSLAASDAAARQAVVDALDGLDELVSFGVEALAASRVEQAFRPVEAGHRRLRAVAALSRAVAVAVVSATTLLVAALAGGLVGPARVDVPSAAAVTFAALGILQLSEPLAGAVRQAGRSRAVWHRLAGTLGRPVETRPRYDWTATPGTVEVRDLSIDRGRGRVVVGLTFAAQPGQTVVLTGRSGAGKTSVLAALFGQLRAGPGQIRTAGRVVRLPQQPHVFRGSVADNLRLGDPDATDELLLDILSLTGLASALGDDPLAQQIGTGGRPLSGGQARRLALAQALLSRPDVLLADEPTEGLDACGARDIWRALRQSRPSMTLILALHDQQLAQLTWTPDTVVRLHADRTAPDVAHPANNHQLRDLDDTLRRSAHFGSPGRTDVPSGSGLTPSL